MKVNTFIGIYFIDKKSIQKNTKFVYTEKIDKNINFCIAILDSLILWMSDHHSKHCFAIFGDAVNFVLTITQSLIS